MLHRRLHSVCVPVVLGLAIGPVHSEWSSNPGANLVIGDGASDQVQPKVRPTSDGGCWISWFAGLANGYDVRLQRLDATGQEQFAHNGILVADLALSSTNDYGLAVDASDNAILAFQDTRFGGTKITVAKVTPAGSLDWGVNGVQVSLGNGNSPHVAALFEGTYVVAWTEASNLRRQKLNANGVNQWQAGGMFEMPGAGNSDLICDVVAAQGGSCFISWVRNPSRFLHANKYGPGGGGQWGGSGIVVFNNSALQFGYFPTFLHDGTGGAVFGYYETGAPRNAYVQRIDSTGTELFPHNGVGVSTNANIRLTPALAYNQPTQEIFLFWTEANAMQNMWGLFGQKFNAAGARQWTDNGRQILPLSGLQNANVQTLTSGSGAFVFWSDQPGNATLSAARLDGAGNHTWGGSGIIQPCTVASSKSRLNVARSDCGQALMAWSDGRSDGGDIYAQNVNANAVLGNRLEGDVNGDNLVDVVDFLGVIGGWGFCAGDPCLADVFPPPCGDGEVTVNDLLSVLANWS